MSEKQISEVTHDAEDPDDKETGRIVVTHEEVPITYHEYPNEWTFELFGKERKFKSLKECKAFIDRPPKDADPKRVFKHQTAFLSAMYSSKETKLVTVTSLCERPDYDKKPRYWVTCPATDKARKKRETTSGESLFMDCPQNRAIFTDIDFLDNQIDVLQERKDAARKKLTPFKPIQ